MDTARKQAITVTNLAKNASLIK